MSFKKLMLVSHRWLGLASGIVVVIVSVTGCLFVFHQEISRWTRSDVMFIEESSRQGQTLPVSVLEKRLEEALNVKQLPYGITTYNNPDRAWKALNYEASTGQWTYFGNIKEYKTAYINPYTGKIAGVVNEESNFFQIVKGLHWSLLLATPIGQPIVTWSTVIFLILLLTGIVLWWPKRWNKSGRDTSFKLRWSSTWRRLNYDLHNVLGFYILLLAFVIAFTGLYWAFPTAKKALYFAGTGQWKLPDPPEKVAKTEHSPADSAATLNQAETSAVQRAYQKAWQRFPQAHNITLVRSKAPDKPLEAHIRPSRQTYYNENHMKFDPSTGKLLRTHTFQQKNAGEKLLAMNYDIHVGAVGGIFGKVLAFIASLVCASLPITGFIIWYNRKRRGRKPQRIKSQAIYRRKRSYPTRKKRNKRRRNGAPKRRVSRKQVPRHEGVESG